MKMKNIVTEKEQEKIRKEIKEAIEHFLRSGENCIKVYADGTRAVYASSNSYAKCEEHEIGKCKACYVVFEKNYDGNSIYDEGYSDENSEGKKEPSKIWNTNQEVWDDYDDVIDAYAEQYTDEVFEEIDFDQIKEDLN